MSQAEHPSVDSRTSGAHGHGPYQEDRRGGPLPDLDATTPILRSEDVRRLNHKAMLFLGGIVLLLLATAYWMFSSLMGSGGNESAVVQGEQLVIPAAPRDGMDGSSPPLAAEPSLPPLPIAVEPDPVAAQPQTRPAEPSYPSAATRPAGMSLRERRMMDLASSPAGNDGNPLGMLTPQEYALLMSQVGVPQPAEDQKLPPQDANRISARPLYSPDKLLLRGTYVRCAMESRVVTDVPGFTSCVVTEPVYSVNGRRMLLPRGTKIAGTYGTDSIAGNRVAVVWDRITTPNGLDVNMKSPGVDRLGGAGHPGHYDAHWGQRIGSALMISMLSDAFKYAAAENGPRGTTVSQGVVTENPYESNTARTLERLANRALESNMARPPTVTLNQGTIVNVYVAQDIDFSAVLR